MASVEVQITDNSNAWLQHQESIMMNGLKKMGVAVMNAARLKAPKKDGPLRQSRQVYTEGNSVVVSFGDNRANYAGIQEKGSRNGKPFRNYTTPGTGAHYLENSGNEKAKEGIGKYL